MDNWIMSTRGELEAALAETQARWSTANADLCEAQAELAEANAAWNKVLIDGRNASTDRRKAGKAWDQTFPDRRKSDSDRPTAEADIAAFAKVVAHQHEAYLGLAKADDAYAVTEMRLDAAAGARDRAVEALTEIVNEHEQKDFWMVLPATGVHHDCGACARLERRDRRDLYLRQASRIETICGCESLPASDASVMNCMVVDRSKSGLCTSSGSSTFSATSFPEKVSRAR